MEHIKDYDLLQPVLHTQKRQITGGQGAALVDNAGNTYLDFNEICVTLGQNNRHFINRMTACLNGPTSNKAGYSSDKEKLYRFLMETTGGQYKAVHLTASGSESAEWAVRMALKITGKTESLSFWNSIHGRTYLSASMSGVPKRKTNYGPIAPGVVFSPYPDCAHCPFGQSCKEGQFFCLDFLTQKVKYESANDIGAVIVEPYQGNGVVLPPKGYLKALQDWAKARGALFIMDEIQSGMGRTGQMYFHTTEEGVEPDMLLLGKALGNGLHISAVLTKQAPQEKYLYALTGGAGDDALACAAACAVFEELLENGLLQKIKENGARMAQHLSKLQEKYPAIKAVRSVGLAAAVEMTEPQALQQLKPKLQEARLLVGVSDSCTFMLKPPYTVTAEQIDQMAAILDNALAKLS